LENKLLDVKTRAVRKLGVTQMQDAEEIREAAQRELVTALMSAFKDRLEMKCYREVRKVVKSVVGYE
jgi:molecular chaperone HtpG